MSDNLRHWRELRKTDPKHTKPFQREGGFRGTATKPIWMEMRLTEHFGPCGVGWGCDEPIFNLVPAGDEIIVFCTVRAWYMESEKQATVYGVGGDKVLVKQRSGIRSDDEAYKKAFTDALGNAFKHVGAGADVHMGLFEDSKYINEMRRQFAEEKAAPPNHQSIEATDPFPDEPPQLPEAAVEFVAAVRKRINDARLPSKIDDLIKANANSLARLKADSEAAYDDLMRFANMAKNELLIRAA